MGKVQKLLDGPGYVLPGDVLDQLARTDTTWTIGIATVDYASFQPAISPSDAEIAKVFPAKRLPLRDPAAGQRRQLRRIFRRRLSKAGVTVTDAEVRAYYDANRARFPRAAPKTPPREDSRRREPHGSPNPIPPPTSPPCGPQVEAALKLEQRPEARRQGRLRPRLRALSGQGRRRDGARCLSRGPQARAQAAGALHPAGRPRGARRLARGRRGRLQARRPTGIFPRRFPTADRRRDCHLEGNPAGAQAPPQRSARQGRSRLHRK